MYFLGCAKLIIGSEGLSKIDSWIWVLVLQFQEMWMKLELSLQARLTSQEVGENQSLLSNTKVWNRRRFMGEASVVVAAEAPLTRYCISYHWWSILSFSYFCFHWSGIEFAHETCFMKTFPDYKTFGSYSVIILV